MGTIEDLQFEIERILFGLSWDQLLDACECFDLPKEQSEGKQRRSLTRILQNKLTEKVAEEGAQSNLQALKQSLEVLGGTMDAIQVDDTDKQATTSDEKQQDIKDPNTVKPPELKPISACTPIIPAAFRKELRISGQVGDAHQKDRLSYSSLNHQIEAALGRGYGEAEVVEAVLRAINPGLRLRSYLENHSNLTLTSLKTVLKSHYQEKEATDLYQELSQLVQGKSETPQGFVMRALDLRQRIVVASGQASHGLKYDPALVQDMFLHAVITGLTNDNVRHDLKPFLQSEIPDEILLERLNVAASLEEKRLLKSHAKPTVRVAAVSETPDRQTPTTPPREKPRKEGDAAGLAAQIAELKTRVAELQGRATQPPTRATQPPMMQRRPRGCDRCRKQGEGDRCRHCYRCGADNHFARGCNLRRDQPGNDSGAHQGDRV